MYERTITDIVRRELKEHGERVPPRVPQAPYKYVSSLPEDTDEIDVVTAAFVFSPEAFLDEEEIKWRTVEDAKVPIPQEDAVFVQFGKEAGLEAPEIVKLYTRWLFRQEIPVWLYQYCAAIIAFK